MTGRLTVAVLAPACGIEGRRDRSGPQKADGRTSRSGSVKKTQFGWSAVLPDSTCLGVAASRQLSGVGYTGRV